MKHGCKTAAFAAGTLSGLLMSVASAADLDIADRPLFLPGAVAPLNMLVMGRDHKLYYEAYNDRSDLNGGGIDIGYKPSIEYFGYFDSYKCYTHDTAKFVPTVVTTDKTCAGALEWSGDWLNWATTARIDALSKVLFGGRRSTDTSTMTVLERTHIPQDAHSWVKEYRSIALDGYDIDDYTPYVEPTAGLTHLFANVTLMRTTSWTTNTATNYPPMLRVAENVARNPDLLAVDPGNRAWNWASTEAPVAGGCYGRDGGNDGRCAAATGGAEIGTGVLLSLNTTSFVNLPVRVEVCVTTVALPTELLEDNCRQYPSGNYKPTGLLQEYGESEAMRFGLLTGSYQLSKSGGVLRKAIGNLEDEINIDTDGTFKTPPAAGNIIGTLSRLRAAGYKNYRSTTFYNASNRGTGVQYMTNQTTNPPSGSGLVTTRPFNEPEFGGMWGNPVGEMMYETLRYFAGLGSATAAFDYGAAASIDSTLGLPRATWDNPYSASSLSCAKPFMTVVSDINTSYDTDQLPGKYFTGTAPADTLGGLNVANEANTIWSNEIGVASRDVFIGQSAATYDGAPSPKSASSFGNIRGLSPEEPTKEGGYYAASVAKYGYQTDLHTATGPQKVQTFAVALASPLPRIEIPVNGRTVTLVPFAKSVGGSSIDRAPGQFQPTNQIVDFYVETMAPDFTSGSFLINFEDVESGNDHDMDTVVRYSYSLVGAQVQVVLDRLYEAGGITHHMGYTISGTTADGTYLVVQDDASDMKYFVDTPAGVSSGGCASSPYCGTRPSAPQALPWSDTRLFTPGTTGTATLLRDPLWYAAKWGGFDDSNANARPDVQSEWDANGDGNPDNYFLVTNALTLGAKLRSAFDAILTETASAAAVATNTTRLDTNTLIYQAQFKSDDWTGKLLAYHLNADGTLGTLAWDASAELPDYDDRSIFTHDGMTGVPFLWDDIGAAHQAALNLRPDLTPDSPTPLGAERLAWVRGDTAQQKANGGVFRNRSSALGDIINSDPQFVGAQNFGYESLPVGTPGRDTYQAFRRTKIDVDGVDLPGVTGDEDGRVLQPMVYVGANDAMLHAFDAATGEEKFAYIPSTLVDELNQLTDPSYAHRYFVDGQIAIGDAFIPRGGAPAAWASVLVGTTGAGGKTVFALDVTRPHAFTEDDVMWEFTHPELGNPIGQPAIARMADGTWVAIFANGYNSASQHAMLFIVNLETGVLVRPPLPIDTGVGTLGVPNGLATPSLLADGARTIRAAYAGDLAGNLWKFDLSNPDPSMWGVAFGGSPLFTATDDLGVAQPITAPPEIGRHPDGGYMLYFGTGKFFETGDNLVGPATPQVQSFYGVWDKTVSPSVVSYTPGLDGRETILTRQSILYEGKPASSHFFVRVTSEEPTNWSTARGWFIDLVSPSGVPKGERVVSLPLLRNGRVIFPTLIPSENPCAFGGGSWLMEMEAVSGERLEEPPLDITENGTIDAGDLVTVTIDGVTKAWVPSAIQSREGIIDTPAVVTTPDGNEIKVASGTSGAVEAVREAGSGAQLRGSWRQLR
jgi:type IV pilus assembly protein PilY1